MDIHLEHMGSKHELHKQKECNTFSGWNLQFSVRFLSPEDIKFKFFIKYILYSIQFTIIIIVKHLLSFK